MIEFFTFLGRFWWKLARLTGVVALAQSRPAQFLWHSPTLSFTRQWLVPFAVVGLVLAKVLFSNSEFEEAKRRVQSRPLDASAHFQLAVTAAKEDDFVLAEKEFTLANQLIKKSKSQRVLGAISEMEVARKLVFPEEAVMEEIYELEQVLINKPGYRDILLKLAVLNWQIEKIDKAREYFEKARILDPNNEMVGEVGELISN